MNPVEQRIRAELTSIVPLCIRGDAPFSQLRRKPPYNRIISRISSAAPELRQSLVEDLIRCAEGLLIGFELDVRAAAERVNKYYREALTGEFSPPRVLGTSPVAVSDLKSRLQSIVCSQFPDIRLCKRKTHGLARMRRAKDTVAFQMGNPPKRHLFLLFAPDPYNCEVGFAVPSPFFVFDLGHFWGLGHGSWQYDTIAEFESGLHNALDAVEALWDLLLDAVARGLSS